VSSTKEEITVDVIGNSCHVCKFFTFQSELCSTNVIDDSRAA
jgi:hypothetical protein